MMIKKATWQIFCAVLVCGWILPVSTAQAVCVEPAGDVTKDGITNVVDIQCSILASQYVLAATPLAIGDAAGAEIPTCVQGNLKRADVNCSDTTTVTDVIALVYTALGQPLNPQVDADGDQCIDACAGAVCGDGTCDAELGEACHSCPSDCGICEGSCCDPHPSGGCDNAKVTSCVCNSMPECCTGEWNEECVAFADSCGAFCPVTEGPGNCCSIEFGAVGCAADSGCETCVCDALPYCCAVAWDEQCIQCAAGQGCGINTTTSCKSECGCDPVLEPTNLCCEDKLSPGCGSEVCEDCVCAYEPACCDVAWDGPCDVIASGLCNESCGCFPKSGSCCEGNGSPGCADLGCELCICETAPECCTGEFTEDCAFLAAGLCQEDCGCGTPVDPPASCCAEHNGPGCPETTCEECVCDINPFCCDAVWDDSCVAAANQLCELECGCDAGDCCNGKSGPGCVVPECETCVCDLAPECCDGPWTEACADLATEACGTSCDCPETGGSCCAEHNGIGCDVPACEDCVCAGDAGCCELMWDATCADRAYGECAGSCECQPQSTGDCCSPNAGPGCKGPLGCTECVCSLDGACCDVAWDGDCVALAGAQCQEECGCPADCCTAHSTGGCAKAVCEDCVCDVEAYCCQVGWDESCVAIANGSCKTDCKCPYLDIGDPTPASEAVPHR